MLKSLSVDLKYSTKTIQTLLFTNSYCRTEIYCTSWCFSLLSRSIFPITYWIIPLKSTRPYTYLPWEITTDYIFQVTNFIILAINEIMMTLKNNIKMINQFIKRKRLAINLKLKYQWGLSVKYYWKWDRTSTLTV